VWEGFRADAGASRCRDAVRQCVTPHAAAGAGACAVAVAGLCYALLGDTKHVCSVKPEPYTLGNSSSRATKEHIQAVKPKPSNPKPNPELQPTCSPPCHAPSRTEHVCSVKPQPHTWVHPRQQQQQSAGHAVCSRHVDGEAGLVTTSYSPVVS
jgi:hypothetical protein